MAKKEPKTNAMRILEKEKIRFEIHRYECEEFTDGVAIADMLGQPYDCLLYTSIIASVYEKIEQTGLQEGILFIDEINCVSETLAPTMLQFLQCKTFGNQKVPEGWVIVAAGNPPEYNKSVREFDVVTLDRIKLIRCV